MAKQDTEDGDRGNQTEEPAESPFLFRFLERNAPKLLPLAGWLSLVIFERDAERLHAVLDRSSRIDIEPLSAGGRGFRLIIDRRTALYFHQDGDGFDYDGYEVGEYDKGDVTIFDDMPVLPHEMDDEIPEMKA